MNDKSGPKLSSLLALGAGFAVVRGPRRVFRVGYGWFKRRPELAARVRRLEKL
jgi:hypothetical protein